MTLVSGVPLILPIGTSPDGAVQEAITLAQPPVLTSVGYKISANFNECVISIVASLTTSAAVGNRTVLFQMLDADGHVFYQAASPFDQPANAGYLYQAAINLVSATGPFGGRVFLPLLAAVLPSGFSVGFTWAGAQAGDQWGAPSLLTQRYSTRPVFAVAPATATIVAPVRV